MYLLLATGLLLYDLRCSHHSSPGAPSILVKALSLSLPLLLLISDIVIGRGELSPECGAVDIIVGAVVILFYPDGRCPERVSLLFGGCVVVVSIALSLIPLLYSSPEDSLLLLRTIVMPLNLVTLIIAYQITKLLHKYKRMAPLFSNEEVWNNVVDMTETVYRMVVLLSILFMSMYSRSGSRTLYLLTVISALVALSAIYIRQTSKHTLFLSTTKERYIKEIVKGSLRNVALDGELEDNKMAILYRRLTDLMDASKPFLDSSVDLDYFARRLYTNKVYLSKTINVFSGRNFRQFLNYYRINFSVELMKSDPRLLVEEVAHRSGFNSPVSFNMAFKMFMGCTPRLWLETYRDSLRL